MKIYTRIINIIKIGYSRDNYHINTYTVVLIIYLCNVYNTSIVLIIVVDGQFDSSDILTLYKEILIHKNPSIGIYSTRSLEIAV